MKSLFMLLIGAILYCKIIPAQEHETPAIPLFASDQPLLVTLTFDQKHLIKNKHKEEYQPASFTCTFEDNRVVEAQLRLKPRGVSRRNLCLMPPLKLKFEDCSNPSLHHWDEIKLVTYCKGGSAFEQYVLAEYMCYKMYNLLTDKSFKVRLAKITYEDTGRDKVMEDTWGFFIEDVDILADRLNGKELDEGKFHDEEVNKKHMTLVAMYEYFLGNTDWSVPAMHNVKLIDVEGESAPYVIPYDFDYAGIISTTYAVPNDKLGLDNVRERLFRGYCRSEEEYQEVFELFNQKRDEISSLIESFAHFNNNTRKKMLNYIEDFYQIINNSSAMKWVFFEECRKD